MGTIKKKNTVKKPKTNKPKKDIIKIVKKDKPNKEKVKKVKKPRKWSTKNIILVTLLSIGITTITISIIGALYIILSAPKFDKSLLYEKEMTVLKDKNGEVFAKLGPENREIVYYDDLPQVLIDAIVAVEDARFFQHNGFDIVRFIKASFGQLAGQSGAGGASTLTMQVTKNTYTSTDATGISGLIRKFTDIYFSVFKLEKVYTKEEIIEFYVNTPWLGNGCWGVEAASQEYFGKSVRDLTLSEAALMAGIFNSPANYNPFDNIELATKRRNIVLNLMVKHGYITEKQKEYAENITVESLIVKEEDRETKGLHKYQSFIDVVVNEVQKKTGKENNPYSVPMIIETTLDPKVQDVLYNLDKGKYYKFVDDLIQTAVAITNVHDGSITGILGAHNQKNYSAYNRATEMFRHPGSTAKPIFDYGPFIEFNNGNTYSPFFDEKMTYSDGTPLKNSDGTYKGLMTAREALKQSRNIPALQAFQQVNKKKIANFVHSLGINYGDNLYESMSIGGFDGTSPLQISAAYAAFASGGYYTEPYSFTKITFIENDKTFVQKPKRVKVMSEETAYMINSMLISTAKYGVAGRTYVSGTDIAAKSGTSTYPLQAIKDIGIPSKDRYSLSRDNWVNVYSPDYSIAVWYGYDILMKDHYTTAIKGDAERKKITSAVANRVFKKNSRFKVPSGVVSVKVEKETFPAMLPSEFTPKDMIVEEVFRKGTEPTEISNRYNKLADPENPTYNYENDKITIKWDPIRTPDAIDINSLQDHFNKYYKDHAEKYYAERLVYNEEKIGQLGYNVYLKTNNGLESLGFTEENTYTHSCPTKDCTYVIKSSFTKFKDNTSTGIEISTKAENINPFPTPDPDPDPDQETTPDNDPENISIIYKNGKNICLKKGTGLYNDNNPLTIYLNDIDITNDSVIRSEYYLNNNPVTNINLENPGNYLIKYYIGYKENTYNGSKKINICHNGCNENNECI